MDQDAAHEVACHHDSSGAAAVVYGGHVIGLQAQREGRGGQQFTVSTVDEDGHLRSHGG